MNHFGESRALNYHAAKTWNNYQIISSRKLPLDYSIQLGNTTLQPMQSVKLLGVHLDRHFTMATHIDKVVKKCHGLLGALARATPFLSVKLLKMFYTAVIRCHLEYASTVVAMASTTQLHKLDIIQKAAARVITGSPRLAHSEPLLVELKLDTLAERRSRHLTDVVNSIVTRRCHPALLNLLSVEPDGSISCSFSPRTTAGRKSFQNMAVAIYNHTDLS